MLVCSFSVRLSGGGGSVCVCVCEGGGGGREDGVDGNEWLRREALINLRL